MAFGAAGVPMALPRFETAVLLLTLAWSIFTADASWCQADAGSCVGEVHAFEKRDDFAGPELLDAFSPVRVRTLPLSFGDWNEDGKVDIFYQSSRRTMNWLFIYVNQQLANNTVQQHSLVQLWTCDRVRSFKVLDWNRDKKLDMLFCQERESPSNWTEVWTGVWTEVWTEVTFLDHSFIPFYNSEYRCLSSMENISLVLRIEGNPGCDLMPVDFDEDGDVDLFLGTRYFERISSGDLIERKESPMDVFNGEEVLQIADIDGDGHVEVVTADNKSRIVRPRYFRRALDGSFTEPLQNPLAQITYQPLMYIDSKAGLYFTDWDSDGLVDAFVVILHSNHTEVHYYQHVRNLDLAYNSHFTAYENIKLDPREFRVLDWNQDGWEDVVVSRNDRVHVYEVNGPNVMSALVQPCLPGGCATRHTPLYGWVSPGWAPSRWFTVIDWDGDGDQDLIIVNVSSRTVHFYEMKSGTWQPEQAQHPFRHIRLDQSSFQGRRGHHPLVLFVDWDADGDLDLISASGRVFKQQTDGTLLESGPLQESPFRFLCSNMSWNRQCHLDLRFVDCDGDGDFDAISRTEDGRFQACEHDNIADTLRCSDNFLCLGTNLSHLSLSTFQSLDSRSWDLATSSNRLRLFVSHSSGMGIFQWTAGFCVPSSDPCHEKGHCRLGQTSCTCFSGHELGDCSQCEPNYHTVPSPVAIGIRDCQPCPGEGSNVCQGRGKCLDDAAMQALAPDYAAALRATGNGSCRCHEAYFNGSDDLGRSTCSDGTCPAGTEERDGHCHDCDAGLYSLPGGSCRNCGLGKYSEVGSHLCLECPLGHISTTEGASVCAPCAGGKYEVQRKLCSDCPAGKVSLGGNASCTKCPAGYVATQPGSISCEPCASGTYSNQDASKCIRCLAGTSSSLGSGICSSCEPGSVSDEGASICERCPAGKFEFKHQTCSDCPAGKVSLGGNASCTKCPAGWVAPESGSIICKACPEGAQEMDHQWCQQCPRGKFVSNRTSFSCTECQAGYVAKNPGSMRCEPCPPGTFSAKDGISCTPCPSGKISDSPGSAECQSCDGTWLIRATADVSKQFCRPDAMNIFLAIASVVALVCFCFFCCLGLHGRVPVADLSSQGEKLVITTALPHLLLKGSCPYVTFADSGVPHLQSVEWKVKALNSVQLTLLKGSDSDSTLRLPVDTSMGDFRIKFPGAFLHIGLCRCPVVIWCLLFGTAGVVTMLQLTWSLRWAVTAVAILAASLGFAWRCRQGRRSPLFKRRQQFVKEWPLVLQACDRGPDRSMRAGQLQDFVQFFEAFIKERSMYYVCSNIVKPITEPFQLSFVEVVGPTAMQWFVSHYWGMAVRHFNDAIRKHAQSYAADWRSLSYWICTFSNSQWHVRDELGNGEWQDSSFYLALRSPSCRGTAMVIDEQVLPLQRIWCLFEVYHTISLADNDHFEGLLLCTSTGVLQQGRAGTDVSVRVAERAADLDTRAAEATNEEDRQMIHDLIERMPGGFETMNSYVQEKICEALQASHQHYEATFTGLICDLTSRVAAARAQTAPVETSPNHPNPTLLTSSAASSHGERAGKTVLPEGQKNPPDVAI